MLSWSSIQQPMDIEYLSMFSLFGLEKTIVNCFNIIQENQCFPIFETQEFTFNIFFKRSRNFRGKVKVWFPTKPTSTISCVETICYLLTTLISYLLESKSVISSSLIPVQE